MCKITKNGHIIPNFLATFVINMKIKKKNIIAIACFAVIAVAAIVCWTRWDAWFAQPEEAPYLPSSTPDRVLLTPGNSGELSRNVSWMCDTALQDSHLELSIAGDSAAPMLIAAAGEVFASRAGKAAYYHAKLDSLAPNRRYAYRAVTGDQASQWHEFSTHGSGNRDFSFIYVGDVQDTIGGNANAYLRAAFDRHPDAELLVCGGDLTERPRDADWAQTFAGLDSIGTAVPVMTVTGNHDYLKGVISKLERRFSLIFSYFLDSKINDNQVYRLRYGNAEFFLVDTFRELPYLLTQSDWLKRSLADSDAKWKIVVMHHPMQSIRGKGHLPQRWAFADVIEEGGVDLVLQGHEHNYARRSNGGKAPAYIISHCSPKSYDHKTADQWDKTHFDSRYYQHIRTHGDTLTVATYEVYTDSLIDEIDVIRN